VTGKCAHSNQPGVNPALHSYYDWLVVARAQIIWVQVDGGGGWRPLLDEGAIVNQAATDRSHKGQGEQANHVVVAFQGGQAARVRPNRNVAARSIWVGKVNWPVGMAEHRLSDKFVLEAELNAVIHPVIAITRIFHPKQIFKANVEMLGRCPDDVGLGIVGVIVGEVSLLGTVV
jgi:hypothetical protein